MSPPLSFKGLTDALVSVFDVQIDGRQANKTRYSLSDAGLAAFAVFFMQSPSFLAYQRDMKRRKGTSNAHTLFGIEQIPTDTHIRNLLDPVPPAALFAPFRQVFRALGEEGVLERFKTAERRLLLALDGTEHFSSEKICCARCTRHLLTNGKTRYSHSVVTPTIVSPEESEVIGLEPAFVLPQDGEEKQDCEIKAAKRWFTGQALHYELEGTIVLGDDLYCHQPSPFGCRRSASSSCGRARTVQTGRTRRAPGAGEA